MSCAGCEGPASSGNKPKPCGSSDSSPGIGNLPGSSDFAVSRVSDLDLCSCGVGGGGLYFGCSGSSRCQYPVPSSPGSYASSLVVQNELSNALCDNRYQLCSKNSTGACSPVFLSSR